MIKFTVKYFKNPTGKGKELSHQYIECWGWAKYYCPHCGNTSVWTCLDGGDYYVGEQHICLACSHSFYLPDGTIDTSENEQGAQRLKHLRGEV